MLAEPRDASGQALRTDRRREISRRQGQQRRLRIALLFIGLFLLALAGSAVAIYVKVFVLPSRQLVVRVDDVKYTRGDLFKLLQARQKLTELFGGQFQSGTEVFEALQLLVENEVIAQSAPKLGISVSGEEVDAEIRDLFAPLSASGLAADPTQAEREFQERYKSYLNSTQLNKEEYRQQVRKSQLREKARQLIGDRVPTVAEQVHLHRIVMSPEDEIDVMQVKLKDAIGDTRDPDKLQEAVKQIVREFSLDDAETVRKGGDLGWVPIGIFNKFDYVIFDLEVGKLSEPTPNPDKTNEIYFFIVSDRQEAREVDANNRDTLKTRALQDWLNQERSSHDVYAVFNSEIYDWVIKELRTSSSRTPTPQPNPLGF